MPLALPAPPDNAAIGDTVAAVFRDPAYARAAPTLWELALRWLRRWLGSLLDAAASHPAAGTVLRWGVITAVALIVARLAYAVYLRYAGGGTRLGVRRQSTTGRNWWEVAQRLAAAGEYIDAAHALYLALLHAAARRGHVTLHESKTIGDYLREMRARGASPAGVAFTDFARTYETVVYGVGTCDASQFQRLRDLAAPVIAPVAALVAGGRL